MPGGWRLLNWSLSSSNWAAGRVDSNAALLAPSNMSMDESVPLAQPQLPPLQNRDNNDPLPRL